MTLKKIAKRQSLPDLVLRAFETRGDADLMLYLQSLLSDIRFLLGPEDCPVMGFVSQAALPDDGRDEVWED